MTARRGLGIACLLSIVALSPAAARSGSDQELARQIGDYAGQHDFNGSIAVESGGDLLYHEGHGLADRAFEIPTRVDTRFKIASITKVFTAALILQLHEEGKIDLRAPIRRYLPDYAGEGADRVTIHHLLNHTSGIENYDRITTFEEAAAKGLEVYQLPHTTAELLDRYASGSLVHEVGEVFDYNNADYVILGKIIEATTGKTYEEALTQRLLGPLGMTSSGMLFQHEIVPRLAPTYLKVDDEPLRNDLPVYGENWYAAGAMYSTTADLLRFSRALFGARLLKPETLSRMLTPGLDDYGYGLWVAEAEIGGEVRRFAHRPGSIMGANAVLLRYLDDDVTVVILGNTSATDLDRFAFFVGRLVLE